MIFSSAAHTVLEVIAMMWTQKEASLLEDLKNQEKVCVEKYGKYAAQALDPELKQLFSHIQSLEQQHEQTVTTMLNGQWPQQNQQTQQQNQQAAKNPPPAYTTPKTPEKEADAFLCKDALSTEKYVSNVYDVSIFEFRAPEARQILNRLQSEEQAHGEMLYAYMAKNGMYA